MKSEFAWTAEIQSSLSGYKVDKNMNFFIKLVERL